MSARAGPTSAAAARPSPNRSAKAQSAAGDGRRPAEPLVFAPIGPPQGVLAWNVAPGPPEAKGSGSGLDDSARDARPVRKLAPADTQPVTVFPVKSIIGRPADGASVKAGPQELAGVAFSGEAAIARVEVSIDGGKTWSDAILDGEPGAGRWQVFRHRFDAGPGTYRAMARATDRAGKTQPERAQWNPSGYLWNAWHAVSWTVIA